MPTADKIRWLKKEHAEWLWAFRYMKDNAYLAIDRNIKYVLSGREPSHEIVEEIIHDLRKTEYGRDFIRRLRNALRQHRYRSASNGKKISTFALPTQTKQTLHDNARHQGKSESSLVAEALDQSDKLIEEYRQQEQRLKEKHELELKLAKQRIELLEVKHHEAMRQIQMLTTRLTTWELALEAEHPEIPIDKNAVHKTSKKKIRVIKKAIKTAEERWRFLQPRL
ncbi:MAG: hypothetical protein CVV07_08540 [Gammaproteobacteria bacterium HGW-Gammaproteobacteria-11]|nr:MAG: hypothetical protein CVV07_08540 [Gammaproteobacteria bacterium HGW-Gammaproteobacteria-11]